MRRWVLLFVVASLAAGCGVSKQIVAEKDAALEACRKELSDCQGQLAAAQNDTARLHGELSAARGAAARAEQARAGCEENLQALRTDADAAKKAAEAARREAEALKQQEGELCGRLRKEIEAKTVEIENLKGKLSVRVVDEILFASGDADILPGGKAVLDKVAEVLAGGTERIRVEGHTDEVPIGPTLKGKWFSNWELSAARAGSVVRYFQYGRNIDPARMEAVGVSAYRPVAPNDTPEGRQKNRRVEIILTAAR